MAIDRSIPTRRAEAVRPIPTKTINNAFPGVSQSLYQEPITPKMAAFKGKDKMTAVQVRDDTLDQMTTMDQVLAIEREVDLLLAPENLELLNDVDLAFEYVMDPEPWEMYLDSELNRLTYYSPTPLSPISSASSGASVASGSSSPSMMSMTSLDSMSEVDSEPEEDEEQEANQYTMYWQSVASTDIFTAPRIHICHVLQQYLESSDPVLGAATAAAALDKGYTDLLLPRSLSPRQRTAELKTGRRMAGYLWALWTTVIELARKGADLNMLTLLLHKLRKLPGRTYAQWRDAEDDSKLPALSSFGAFMGDEEVQKPAFRSVKVWGELIRLEEIVQKAWQCSSHRGFFDTLDRSGTSEWVNFITFVGRLFADGFLSDWSHVSRALDNALGERSRLLPLHVIASNVLVSAAFIEKAGASLLEACIREQNGLNLSKWRQWIGFFDDIAAFEHEGTLPAMYARERMLRLLEDAVASLPEPLSLGGDKS